MAPRQKASAAGKVWLIIGVAVAVLVATGGFFWHLHNVHRHVYKGPVEHLTTGQAGEYATLLVIAQQKGYFRQHGLDVELKQYGSGPDIINDIVAGKLDMGMASDFATVRAAFDGQDIQVLTNLSKSNSFYVVARKDRGINDITDIKNKKIGVTRKTAGEYYLGQFLILNRLGLSDVKIVDASQAELSNELATGQLDAAVFFEPNAYQAANRLGANAQRWSIQNGQSLFSLLLTSSKLVHEKPDTIKRYLQAVVQAENFVATHDSEARSIVAQYYHYDDAYINYIWPQFTFAVSLDQELVLDMEDEGRWVIDNHLTSATVVPNYLRFIYSDALQNVKPDGLTIIH